MNVNQDIIDSCQCDSCVQPFYGEWSDSKERMMRVVYNKTTEFREVILRDDLTPPAAMERAIERSTIDEFDQFFVNEHGQVCCRAEVTDNLRVAKFMLDVFHDVFDHMAANEHRMPTRDGLKKTLKHYLGTIGLGQDA